jgi:DNA (cytosine-5)-methyltransferase 1
MARILDLFCGAGGAAEGYHRAGFDVVGVDIVDQPRYRWPLYEGDAVQCLRSLRRGSWHGLTLDMFDAIHASPPCQFASMASPQGRYYPNLIPATKRALQVLGKPWVIENVPQAGLRKPILLCGTMFGLRVIRHRAFETWPAIEDDPPPHRPIWDHPKVATRTEDLVPGLSFLTVAGGGVGTAEEAGKAMGINWMKRRELNEAVPPAYTEWVGSRLPAAS